MTSKNDCPFNDPISEEIVKHAIKTGIVSSGCAKILQASGELEKISEKHVQKLSNNRYCYHYNFTSDDIDYQGLLGFNKKMHLVSIHELKPIEIDQDVLSEKAESLMKAIWKCNHSADRTDLEKIYKTLSKEEIRALIFYSQKEYTPKGIHILSMLLGPRDRAFLGFDPY